MNRIKTICVLAFLLALVAIPGFAQEGAATPAEGGGWGFWGVVGAAFAIGVAALGGALGQARAISAACSGMARNPGAAANIRTTLIIGLAFIESLVIYALVIALKGVGII